MRRRTLLAGATLLIVSACAQPGVGGDLPELLITTRDYHFEAPESTVGGLVRVVVENDGPEAHQVELVRARGGAKIADIVAAVMETDVARLDALVTYHGGPNEVPPGERRVAITRLEPGRYVLLCFVASDDGVVHAHKGMIGTLDVSAAADGAESEPPAADAEVVLSDFDFQIDGELSPGRQLVRVRNVGSVEHELRIMRGAAAAGGSSTISPGTETWVELVLEAGRYQLVCHVPDAASGLVHANLGMQQLITVE